MTRFSPLDYAVVATYLIGVVILGLIFFQASNVPQRILSRQLKSPLVGRGDLDDRHPAQSDQLPGYRGLDLPERQSDLVQLPAHRHRAGTADGSHLAAVVEPHANDDDLRVP